MLRAVAIFGLTTFAVLALGVAALHTQVPLQPGRHWQDNPQGKGGHDAWNLDKLPNPNSTDHLVFETVHSLLQHWPNTRMRNGHTIVPGTIPKGTLLYHGTRHKALPPGPEWVGTDPEHSFFFCREAQPKQGCWHITLMATRPLKVVYFDGSSAANLPYGSIDTQDLVVWDGVRDEWDETHRILDLCKWGKNFGVDGFVRMEMDFEVMLCDFTAGLNVVSFANLARQQGAESPMSGIHSFQVMMAGSWHNHFPGETRIQLDLPGLVSFYDTQLVPSLVPVRSGQERWDHRARDISDEDLSALKSRLEAALTGPPGQSSGIDWQTLIQVIVDRFAGRLELMRYLLDSAATKPDELLDLANKAQTQLRIMLTPYILLSARPTDPSDKTDFDWTRPIYRLCATTHTYSMDSELDSRTASEKLLLQAVRGTSQEICRVVTRMWATGVYAGIDPSLNTKDALDVAEITQILEIWSEDLNGLMSWLDWSTWVKCNPACGPEEICYLPTWPVGFPGFPPGKGRWPRPSPDVGPSEEMLTGSGLKEMRMGRLAKEVWNSVKPEPDEWIRPQPKCITQVDRFDF